MNVIRLFIVIGALGFALHWWENHGASPSQADEASPNGFVSVAMPDGVPDNTVAIMAPLNCPSDAAQRADALASHLTQLGIPNTRSSSYSSSITEPTAEQRAAIERAVSVLNGEIPAVFVNGMGKSNPTAEEVAAEYERTR